MSDSLGIHFSSSMRPLPLLHPHEVVSVQHNIAAFGREAESGGHGVAVWPSKAAESGGLAHSTT